MSQIPFAKLSWQNDTPCSEAFNDIYFTPEQGLAESRTVFLHANALPERWNQLKPGESFTMFETGFGTGLNFFATLDAWYTYIKSQSHKSAPCLNFISVEKHPLTQADFLRISQYYPQFAPYAQQLAQQLYPLVTPGLHRLYFAHQVQVLLWIGDLQEIDQIILPEPQKIAAWFLDGFAPAKNPCLLYTSPSPRDLSTSRMPSSA